MITSIDTGKKKTNIKKIQNPLMIFKKRQINKKY